MSVIRLTTCENSIEANLMKGNLENEGINSFITNENFSALMPNYNNILGAGVQIMIEDSDYEKAVEIIGICQKEVVCPNCQSKNITYRLGENKMKKMIIILISLFSGMPFNNINRNYYCKDCKTSFK